MGSEECCELGSLGSAVSSPTGVWGGAPTAQRFSTISALRMTSPDTVILLIVDYHAAIGGKTPVPLLRTPLKLMHIFEPPNREEKTLNDVSYIGPTV